jgi:hypothetical protein
VVHRSDKRPSAASQAFRELLLAHDPRETAVKPAPGPAAAARVAPARGSRKPAVQEPRPASGA